VSSKFNEKDVSETFDERK